MSSPSDKARKFSRDHAERFIHELHEFLRIPSLSGDPAYAKDVKRAADKNGRSVAETLDIMKRTEDEDRMQHPNEYVATARSASGA